MKVAIASGKGGTGKTTVAVNLAHVLAQNRPVKFIDCDAEEPNARFFVRPTWEIESVVTIRIPEVDRPLCIGCGECVKACAFNALAVLGDKALVFKELCHGCGGCTRVCPTGAISEVPHRLGVVSGGRAGNIHFIESRIDVGTPLAVPVIQAAKKEINPADDIVIMDAPPGTSCPVVATMVGSDYVALVTEPTPFGLNDLELAVELVRELGIDFGVIVNKAGIGTDDVENYCRREGIPIILEIPFDRRYAAAIADGQLLVEAFPEWHSRLEQLWDTMREGVRA